MYGTSAYTLDQWFLTWGKFTPRGKFHLPKGKIYCIVTYNKRELI